MQIQSEKTCDQSKQSSVEGIENLKKRITYSNAQLHQLISTPDQLTNRIKELNKKASKQNADEMYEEAIVYLTEAQRNLEYAANCGLSIDRVLITTTLKNQACIYQRLWELGTCYDYMEALISNMKIYNENAYDLFENEAIRDNNSQQSKKINKILNQTLCLALSHLQFSALSSQLGKHQQAHIAVQRSLEQFRQLSKYCHSYEKTCKGKTSLLLNQLLGNIITEPQIKISKCLKDAKNAIQKISSHSYFFTFDQKLIEKLSMGDIMQINFFTVEEASKTLDTDWFISQLGLIYVTIYVSCCYFALATQIRLGVQKVKGLEEQNKSKIDRAKFYHLHSIKMASQLVLIQSSFLQHIMRSFKNNFNIDIQKDKIQQSILKQEISEIQIVEGKSKIKLNIKTEEDMKFQSGKKKSNDISKANSPSQFVIESATERTTRKQEKEKDDRETHRIIYQQNTGKTGNYSPNKHSQILKKSQQNGKKNDHRSKTKSNPKKIQPFNRKVVSPQLQKNKKHNQYYSNIVSKPLKREDKNLGKQQKPKKKQTRGGSSSHSKVKPRLKNFKSPNRLP